MFDFSQKAIDAKENTKGSQTRDHELVASLEGASGNRKVLRVGQVSPGLQNLGLLRPGEVIQGNSRILAADGKVVDLSPRVFHDYR